MTPRAATAMPIRLPQGGGMTAAASIATFITTTTGGTTIPMVRTGVSS